MTRAVWQQRFLITGGTGLIGSAIRSKISEAGGRATVLSRSQTRSENPSDVFINSLDAIHRQQHFDVVINLAGAPIAGKRWNAAYRQTLLNSRITTTEALLSLFKRLEHGPRRLISASAIGYYGDRGDQILTEDSAPGSNFAAKLCQRWEAVALKAQSHRIPVTVARLAVVMSKQGGSWSEFKRPLLAKVSPLFGAGEQWFSWVYIDDLVNALAFSIERELDGAVLVSAPEALTNRELALTLAEQSGAWLKPQIPACVLRAMLGPMADELLLCSQRVKPERLIQAGFTFSRTRFAECATSLLRS